MLTPAAGSGYLLGERSMDFTGPASGLSGGALSYLKHQPARNDEPKNRLGKAEQRLYRTHDGRGMRTLADYGVGTARAARMRLLAKMDRQSRHSRPTNVRTVSCGRPSGDRITTPRQWPPLGTGMRKLFGPCNTLA